MDIQVILCVYEKMFLISADTMTKGRLARRQAKEQLLHNTLSRQSKDKNRATADHIWKNLWHPEKSC
ncbi:hypothetical protein Y1Q_0007021 [Alligator mississippiensis]|uniref:Uncharacterized protein n=1 Tax=Alligator mississippiensis TaxID=8496 RepID=A0A151N578_ALLMI|nr:hypothetical protein Y1Q_0007021 [Alligator mississippiensis]